MKKKYVKIEGIHCNHCIELITKELLKNKNIKEISIRNNIAHITYDKKINNKDLIKSINDLDYITKEEYISDNLKDIDHRIQLKEFILIILVVLFLWFIINKIFGFNIFNVIPNIDSKITYGMLFVTGLLTSIHCISMCGAINLIAIIDTNNKNYKRPILYNLGRVISYTIIGGLVGLIGSIFTLSNIANGIIILIASLLMLFMALNMLGVISFRIPLTSRFKIKNKSRNSFIIGLLNGLMPCGPLQAMQIYALSTGSFVKGALSMFLFSLGTVPLMLSVGLFYNLIKRKIIINKIASVLILILSIVMLNRALLTLGIDLTKAFNNYDEFTKTELKDNYQEVRFDLEYNDYEDIIVQKDIPVRIIIHVDKKYLTGCNSKVELKDFDIEKELVEGDNIIEFTPTKEGTYTYTCWMNMIKNNIKVIDDKKYFEGE